MAIRFWKHGAHGAWSDNVNWIGDKTPPGVGDIAAFTLDPSGDSLVTGAFTAGELVVLGKGTSALTLAGTLTLLGVVPNAQGTIVGVPALRIDEWRTVNLTGIVVTDGTVDVGRTYGGTLNVSGGLYWDDVHSNPEQDGFYSSTIVLGGAASGRGYLTVDNHAPRTSAINVGNLIVGDAGYGKVDITSYDDSRGGIQEVVNIGQAVLGKQAGSYGEIEVHHGLAYLGNAWIGLVGTGLLVIDAGGTSGAAVIGQHGEMRLAGGTAGFDLIDKGGLVDGYGRLGPYNGTIDGIVRADGHLDLQSDNGLTGYGKLQISTGATLTLGLKLAGPSVQFLGPNATLALTPPRETASSEILNSRAASAARAITGFRPTDLLSIGSEITGISFDPASDVLALTDTAASVHMLHFAGSFVGETFVLGHDDRGSTIGLVAAPGTPFG